MFPSKSTFFGQLYYVFSIWGLIFSLKINISYSLPIFYPQLSITLKKTSFFPHFSSGYATAVCTRLSPLFQPSLKPQPCHHCVHSILLIYLPHACHCRHGAAFLFAFWQCTWRCRGYYQLAHFGWSAFALQGASFPIFFWCVLSRTCWCSSSFCCWCHAVTHLSSTADEGDSSASHRPGQAPFSLAAVY